mmetsp:Transcript_80262/g.227251  ORF Transcript_80262/g.227251 Transcript_80262/m.227251 type:complete len:218 (-) Transcript_80262:155-808(-)
MSSKRESMLMFFFALHSIMGTSPPHSSGMRLSSASAWRVASGLAFAMSILLIATMMGTSAAFACAMASLVWGMTPSLAATTRIAMSVTWAPRARIAVKASCPGVSMNVAFSLVSPTSTVYAPIRCVMPPASEAATLRLRIVSRSVVFPWSTWPMTVTTGGRGCASLCVSAKKPRLLAVLTSSSSNNTSKPYFSATLEQRSRSRTSFSVNGVPFSAKK